MANVIEVSNVYKAFGKGEGMTKVLSGASLNVEKGEFVSLMGASGSGKSTLLYLIGGLDRYFNGTINVCGYDIGKMKEKDLSKLRLDKIGFIFQFYNLVQNLNVEDNILLPSSVKGKSKSEMKAQLDEILRITGRTDKRKAKPSELSGGPPKRVALASAVIGNPEIILADEPTGNLDSNAGAEVMKLFSEINKQKGITILQVTHSHKCAAYGDRIVELVNGRTDQAESSSQPETEKTESAE